MISNILYDAFIALLILGIIAIPIYLEYDIAHPKDAKLAIRQYATLNDGILHFEQRINGKVTFRLVLRLIDDHHNLRTDLANKAGDIDCMDVYTDYAGTTVALTWADCTELKSLAQRLQDEWTQEADA